MTECCAVGATSKLAIGGSRIDFIDYEPTKFVKLLSDGSTKAIRGTLDHNSISVAEGMLFVEFRVGLWMTALKNDLLLPIMGLTESPSNTFTLGDALSPTEVILGLNGSKEQKFEDCYCGRWAISGHKGTDPVRMDLWFTAKTWVPQAANTFFISQTNPALVEGYPYSFTNGTMDLLGEERFFNQFRLAMDYGLVVEHNNSLSASTICPTDHALSIATSVLYSDCAGNTDLFEVPMSGDVSGSSFTLNFNRADVSKSTVFNVSNVKLIARPPRVVKADLARLPVNGLGYALGTSPLLICQNVA